MPNEGLFQQDQNFICQNSQLTTAKDLEYCGSALNTHSAIVQL